MRRNAAVMAVVVALVASGFADPPRAAAQAAVGQVVINEIHYHPSTDGHEFLELHNPTADPLDLTGACFTAGIGGCFAAGTTIGPGGHLVVAESLTAYAIGFPGAPPPTLQYTGALSNSGERVTLAQGATILDTVAYTDTTPWPLTPDGNGPSLELRDPLADNDLATSWSASDPAPTPGATNTQLGVPPGPVADGVVINEIHYHPPTDGHEFLELHNPTGTPLDLTGACFTAGIGGCFAAGTTIAPGGHLVVAESLTAYVIGFPGAPSPTLQYTGALSNSGERVTLAQGATILDTVAYTDAAPWPLSPDGSGPSLELRDPLDDNGLATSWSASDPAPTPGATNTQFGLGLLPTITQVALGPVAAGAPVTLTAQIADAETATLEVTVGFGATQQIPLSDDGAQGDGAPGDGRYGAQIPGQPANALVRYRIVADSGEAIATVPANGDSRPMLGYVVAPSAPTTPLPVLQWFIDPADYDRLLANRFTNDYVPAIVAAGAEVWDGAEVRVQGNARLVNKLSFKFKMPRGFDLVAPEVVEHPVDEFVLDSDRVDSLGVTPIVGFSVYADGNPFVPQHAKVRVHRNGAFYGMYTFLEEFEDNWMDRAGLDQPGFEVYEPQGVDGVLIDEGSSEALEPRFEKLSSGSSYAALYDLVQVIDGPPTPERAARLRDVFDTPALVEFLATGAVLQHWDQTVHNFVLIRDGATGRWRFGPTDLDSILGQPLRPNATGFRVEAFFPYGPDNLVSALRTDPVFSELYARRLRSLTEQYVVGGIIQARADELAPRIAADFAADRAQWSGTHSQAQGRAQLTAYLSHRADNLLSTYRSTGAMPAAATPGLGLRVSELAYAATGGSSHDFVELHNPHNEAIDLSGWQLEGAASAVLPPGTVIAAGGYLVVPGDQQLTSGSRPAGTIVAGELDDGVADGGGTLQLRDPNGSVRAEVTFGTTAPWPTAPASGATTLERTDPASASEGPGSWRASATPSGSPGSSGNLPGPPPANRLSIEAAADQAELRPGDSSGALFTISVANTGTASRPAVTVAGPGSTCPRSIGVLAPGATFTYRCRSLAGAPVDRTYLFSAASGSVRAAAPAVEVRSLRHPTQYLENHLPAAPQSPVATVEADGRLRLQWVLPAPTTAPIRWMALTATRPGQAAPRQGWMLEPSTSAVRSDLPLDQPVQLAVAARNRSGTGPRTPPTPFLTPRSGASFPFSSTAELIDRVYADLDGRAPTAGERELWQALLDGGTSPSATYAHLLARPRWTVQAEPVIRLYVAYFRRLPERGGLEYWLRRREAGVPLDTVSAAFAATSEFRTTYGALSNRGFVELVYRNVLERGAEPTGSAFWTRRLDAGESRGRVMTSFSESSEGRRRLAPSTQTSLVWTSMMGAPPTAAAAQPAIDWLAEGGSVLTVIEGVRTSDAYRGRIG